MEVGHGPKWGCSAKEKKELNCLKPEVNLQNLREKVVFTLTEEVMKPKNEDMPSQGEGEEYKENPSDSDPEGYCMGKCNDEKKDADCI
jgi:hypothetical protein